MYSEFGDASERKLATGVAAAGTTQAAATLLPARFNQISTAAANSGVRLPSGVRSSGMVRARNDGANTVKVYPPVGGKINGGTANAAVTLAAGAAAVYVADGNGNYFTF